ncbi:MAG: cupin domain-containing protein [Planctomycetota bacterium]
MTHKYFTVGDLKARQLLPGIDLRVAAGEQTMMTFFDFAPNAVIPSHKHPHEQITYMLQGEMEMTVAGETKVLKAGDGVVIPGNIEHSARITKGPAKALDGWYPKREDYLK